MKRFESWKQPDVKDGVPTKWHWVVRHPENFELGPDTDIGAFTYINAKKGVVVEEGAQVGAHCSIYSVSTIDDKSGKVVLKKNCRVGANSVVMPGVTIGENAVVGAMSFVTKDVPPDTTAFGIPAQVQKGR